MKGKGPKDTASTRFNASKHGLLAAGVTELDDADGYRSLLNELYEDMKPVGPREQFLVESAALEMIRLRRARRLEAEYITDVLNPRVHESNPVLLELSAMFQDKTVDPGLPAAMATISVQPLVTIYQRYETTISLRLFRFLHELERLQRLRGGEEVPAPAMLDVVVERSVVSRDTVSDLRKDPTSGEFEESAGSQPVAPGSDSNSVPSLPRANDR